MTARLLLRSGWPSTGACGLRSLRSARSGGAVAQIGDVPGDGGVQTEADREVGRGEVGERDERGEALDRLTGAGLLLPDRDPRVARCADDGIGEGDPARVEAGVAQREQPQARGGRAVEVGVGEDVAATGGGRGCRGCRARSAAVGAVEAGDDLGCGIRQ